MRSRLLSFSPHLQNLGFAAVRIVTGVLMAYHGLEVFDGEKMTGYGKWLAELQFPLPQVAAYLGKGSEFVSGLLLVIGLFTRFASLVLALTMLAVCIGMGGGKLFTDDQHPFLFALLGLIFFFTGAGKWSLDQVIFKPQSPNL